MTPEPDRPAEPRPRRVRRFKAITPAEIPEAIAKGWPLARITEHGAWAEILPADPPVAAGARARPAAGA